MTIDLTKLSFPAVMSMALAQSRLSRDDVAAEMGWSPSMASRTFTESDNYWPQLPSVPHLCAVLGNTLILEWMLANANALACPLRPAPLDPETMVLRMGRLFREMSDVAKVGSRAVEDGEITTSEARRIIKELRDLNSELMEMMAAAEAIK
jgi:hypothetical protein